MTTNRQIPYDSIPDKLVLEDQTIYVLEGRKITEKFFGEDGFTSVDDDPENRKGGRLVIQADTQVAKDDPSGLGGTYHSEMFWIGTDTDKNAEDPKTWKSKDGVKYKQFLAAARVPLEGTLADADRVFKGQKFMALASTKEDKKGELRTRLNKQWPYGEVAPGPVGAIRTGGR